MPRLDHRKLEALFFPSSRVSPLLGDGKGAARRRWYLGLALAFQTMYATFAVAFALYESSSGSLVHQYPQAEVFKVMAYGVSCLVVYRSVPAYIRLMPIWTITTIFSGVFQPIGWLVTVGKAGTERYWVGGLLALSILGMIGNIVGAASVFPGWRSTQDCGKRSKAKGAKSE